MGCNKCFRRTSAQYGWNFPCNFCHKEAIAEPRTRFTITFSDNTSELNATMFGEQAERILSLSAIELMNEEQDESFNCDNINMRLTNHWFLVQLKRKEFTTHLGITYQYNVLSLADSAETSTQISSTEPGSSTSYIADSY